MTIEEKSVDQINKSLSHKYREGDKWVVWDDYNGPVSAEKLKTFREIATAYKFCDQHTGDVGGSDFQYYKFRPIINVLKEITGASSIFQHRINTPALEQQIQQSSIESYNSKKSLVELLSDGLFHPVTLKQQVLPWADIESYKVVEHEYPRGMVYEVGHSSRSHGDFKNFYEAQKCFDELKAKGGERNFAVEEILLIGKIKGQNLALNFEDYPQPGTGVLITVAGSTKNRNGEKEYEVRHINDVQKPIEISLQKMAKFNWINSTLNFFDGSLKKVTANAKVDFMNFGHLSTEPVKINNAIQQAVTQYASLQKQEKKIKGLRFRSGW